MELLKICVVNLDKRINKEETLREFIRNSEVMFGIPKEDIDNMEELDLVEYVDYLDYLWGK